MSLTWTPPPPWGTHNKMFFAIFSDKIHIMRSREHGFAVPGHREWPSAGDWLDAQFEKFLEAKGTNIEETPLIPLFDNERYAEKWGKRLWEMGHTNVRIGIIMLPLPRLVYIRLKFANGQKHLLPALSESEGPVTLVSVPQIRECFGVNTSIHTQTGWFSLDIIPKRMIIAVNPVSHTDVGWPYNLLVARQEREKKEREERLKENGDDVEKEEEDDEWELVKTEEADDFSVVSFKEEDGREIESVKTDEGNEGECFGYSNCAMN